MANFAVELVLWSGVSALHTLLFSDPVLFSSFGPPLSVYPIALPKFPQVSFYQLSPANMIYSKDVHYYSGPPPPLRPTACKNLMSQWQASGAQVKLLVKRYVAGRVHLFPSPTNHDVLHHERPGKLINPTKVVLSDLRGK